MAREKKHNFRRFTPASLVILTGLFSWMAIVATSGTVSDLEKDIFALMYGMPEVWRFFALAVTQLGSFWMFVGVIGVLLVKKWDPQAAIRIFQGGALAYSLSFLIKLAVGRPRPVLLFGETTTRELLVLGAGFPSAHAALATVVSLLLVPYLPGRWRWLPLPWILLVCWSRVYLGVHAPLDVLGGLVLGLIVVVLVVHLSHAGTNNGY